MKKTKRIIIFFLLLYIQSVFSNSYNNYFTHKRVVDVAKEYKYLGLGQGDAHNNDTYHEILKNSIYSLVNECNVKYLIFEHSQSYQKDIDNFMETGGEAVLWNLFSNPPTIYSGFNNYGMIQFFKYLYDFNKTNKKKIKVIFAEFPYLEYDKNKDGFLDMTRIGRDISNFVESFKLFMLRDQSAFDTIKKLSVKDPTAHFILFYGDFHLKKSVTPEEARRGFSIPDKLAEQYKTLGQLLNEKYKDKYYSVDINSVLYFLNRLDRNVRFELDIKKISLKKEPLGYSIIKDEKKQFDEYLLYHGRTYFSLNLSFINNLYSREKYQDILNKYLDIGKIEKRDLFFDTIYALSFFSNVYYDISDVKTISELFQETLNEEQYKNTDSTNDIYLKEYIYNLKMDIINTYYNGAKFGKYKDVFLDEYPKNRIKEHFEEIIKSFKELSGNDNKEITKDDILYVKSIFENELNISLNYGFIPWFEITYILFSEYCKENQIDMKEYDEKFQKAVKKNKVQFFL